MPIDFRLRDFFHPSLLWRMHRTLERTQWLPPAELQAHQDALVREQVAHAARRVPYWRERFAELGLRADDVRGAADLTRLPLLGKDALRARPEAFVAEGLDPRRLRWHATSGSTGEPVRFAHDAAADVLEFCYYWRHWSWAGYRLGDRFAELGTAHFLARGRAADAVEWQPHLRRLLLNSARISAAGARAMAAAVRRRRPRFLKGMASALHHLARCLGEAGVAELPFEAVFSTGEVLTDGARAAIRARFGGPVLDSYGHMERTVAIAQCERGGYHVNADYGVLEAREPRTSAEGTTLARVTGTALHGRAMPLLRYDVGDDVELLDEPAPCPCGRTLPLVRRVHGRTQDTIVTSDGRFLTSVFLVFDLVEGIAAAQVLQEAPDRVALLVVPAEGWDETRAALLRERAAELLGPAMRLRVVRAAPHDLARDRSGKLRPVVGLGEGPPPSV